MLCLWTTSFTLIANFAPSGATGNSYYCEVNSAALLQSAAEEINNLTTNTTRENSAVIKLISDIKLTTESVVFEGSAVFATLDEEELEELDNNPRPIAYVTLDLNGHVLTLGNGEETLEFGAAIIADLEIIDSNPTAVNILPDGTTVTGGAVYGNDSRFCSYYCAFLTINGGNFYGNMSFMVMTGRLTINQGVISCSITETDNAVGWFTSGIIVRSYSKDYKSYVNINSGKIDCQVIVLNGEVITDPEIIAQFVKVDENKVNVIKDDAGNIIRCEEIKAEPEPTDPTEPTEPTEQEPNDNKTPVLSGTTNNGQPTSDDFMKIMMIGVLVIVALSVVSIAASLLIIKKYRPHVA